MDMTNIDIDRQYQLWLSSLFCKVCSFGEIDSKWDDINRLAVWIPDSSRVMGGNYCLQIIHYENTQKFLSTDTI